MSARVACVIPALDAAETLVPVIMGVRSAVPRVLVIVVDDGSRDRTRRLSRRNADLTIGFARNRGKGAALRDGIGAALKRRVDFVVTLDADGQHDPQHIPALLRALDDADLVIGARERDRSMPWSRRLTNALASRAVGWIVGARVLDAQSGFRAARRSVLERVRPTADRYEFETEMLLGAALAGFRVAFVRVPTIYGSPSHFRAFSDSARVVRSIWRARRRQPA